MSENLAPAVAGCPRVLLRLEGLALLALALVVYYRLGASWWLFFAVVLAPDLSFAGYLAGDRVGAIVYNAAHTLIGPFALAVAGLTLPWFLVVELALIWTAHIGVDRAIGFGLKYETGFHLTHLGRIGRPPSRDQA